MRYSFSFDQKLCSGCGACAVACMDRNDTDLASGDVPFRTISLSEAPGGERVLCFESLACRHCSSAPCIAACPSGCFFRDEDTGLVQWNNTACIGCRSCLKSCPFNVPSFNADGKMTKCHGCADYIRSGSSPSCVLNCPTGALSIVKTE